MYRRLHTTKISSAPYCYNALRSYFHKSDILKKNNFNKFNNQDVSISKEWILWCIIIEYSNQYKYRKIRTRKNSVFGHFSSSEYLTMSHHRRICLFDERSREKLFNGKLPKRRILLTERLHYGFKIQSLTSPLYCRSQNLQPTSTLMNLASKK